MEEISLVQSTCLPTLVRSVKGGLAHTRRGKPHLLTSHAHRPVVLWPLESPWEHLPMPGSAHGRDSDLTGLGRDLGFGVLKVSSSDSNEQPRLRTT